jgi:predicted acylesterase/phospholipase RssA
VARTVLVLGGGGVLGAYQAGALQALLAHGVLPDAIHGASVGALNAAFLAHDPTPRRAEQLVDWWADEGSHGVLAPRLWNRARSLAAAAFAGGDALLDERPLRRLIERHVGAHDISELAVPLTITTTCLDCGAAAHHSRGPIGDTLLASCALPGLFPTVRLADGHRHVDAGVVCGVPVAAALDAAGPDDRVIVLDCGLAPVTSRVGCAAPLPHASADAGACTVPTTRELLPYVAPVETHRGVLQAVLDSFTAARSVANRASVGTSLADPRVTVLPHVADSWAAGLLDRLPAGPRDVSAVHELLRAGHAATLAWLADADVPVGPSGAEGPLR